MSTLHLVPDDILQNYHVKEWRNAAGIMTTACESEWHDIREDCDKLSLIEPNVVQRKIFSDGVGQGLSVLEAKPRNPDAIQELLGVLAGIGFNQNDIKVIYNGRAE